MPSVLDKWTQKATITVASTAAAAASTSAVLTTGYTNMQKVAWEVSRVEYNISGKENFGAFFAAHSKYFSIGVSNRGDADAFGGAESADPSVLDYWSYNQCATPAAIADQFIQDPIVHDFGNNPRLFIPQTVYGVLKWSGSAALTVHNHYIQIYYKEVELSSADWYDLLQLRMPLY